MYTTNDIRATYGETIYPISDQSDWELFEKFSRIINVYFTGPIVKK